MNNIIYNSIMSCDLGDELLVAASGDAASPSSRPMYLPPPPSVDSFPDTAETCRDFSLRSILPGVGAP